MAGDFRGRLSTSGSFLPPFIQEFAVMVTLLEPEVADELLPIVGGMNQMTQHICYKQIFFVSNTKYKLCAFVFGYCEYSLLYSTCSS
jgi:hypothetical protein